MRYDVTWGELKKRVAADTEADAWIAFAASHDYAQRHPHHHVPEFAVVDENEQSGDITADEPDETP